MKTLNRNAFNEKLIHRYLFERLYFGDKKIIKSLLPEKYHKNKINLITPEESKGGYRADLIIYFKEIQEGVPVEVKWNTTSSLGSNQLEYLSKNNGILISFEKINNTKYKGIDYVSIDHEDFGMWVAENISKLTRESLLYQAKVEAATNGKQLWIVYLRGTAHDNWDKMLSESINKPFWAFKHNSKALKNIFDMQKNDMCLFIKGYAKEGIGMSNNPKLKLEYSGWYLTQVKEPYYMALDEEKGTFFEADNPSINERKRPHFTDFEIQDSFDTNDFGCKTIVFGNRGELSDVLADSVNYGGGTPAPINNLRWESLIDKLKSQKIQTITKYNNG